MIRNEPCSRLGCYTSELKNGNFRSELVQTVNYDRKCAFFNFLVVFMSKIEIDRSERFKVNHVYDFFTKVETLFSQNLSKTSIFGRNCRTF